MTRQQISEIIERLNSGTPVDKAALRLMREEYPFFTLPASLALDNDGTLSDDERADLLNHLALNASDPHDVADRAAGIDSAKFYPDDEPVASPSTDDAISTFINTYGNTDPREEEVLTQLIFNPAPDYAQLLAHEEENSQPNDNEAAASEQDKRINQFIISSRRQGGHFPKNTPPPTTPTDNAPVSNPDPADHSMLTESLAKSYIRQKKYSRALEIITHLSLNYPEKSIYFADQMRFLRKIVLIEQHKTNNKNS